MSRTTIVSVSTLTTSFEFMYATRKPAEDLGLSLHEVFTASGHKAVSVLEDMLGTHNAGEFEASMVALMIKHAQLDTGIDAETIFRQSIEFDETLRRSHSELKTFENVIRNTFHIEGKDKHTQSSLGLTTKEDIKSLLDEALKSTRHGMAAKAIMSGVLSGFTGCSLEKADTETMSIAVLDWLRRDHAEFIKGAHDARRSQFEGTFELNVTHRD